MGAADALPDPITLTREDRARLAALRAGDEAGFTRLVQANQGPMDRLAMGYAPSRAIADEAAHET